MDANLRELERRSHDDHAAALELIAALQRLRTESWSAVPCPSGSCPSSSRPCHTCNGRRFVRVCISDLNEYKTSGYPVPVQAPASPSPSEQLLASFPDLANSDFPDVATGVPHIVSSLTDPKLLQVLAPPLGAGVEGSYRVTGIYIQPHQYHGGGDCAISLEYDKASIEIPAPPGRIVSVNVVIGDHIQPGHALFTVRMV